MSPASQDIHLSEIHTSLLLYMKNHFETTWEMSQSG